MSDSETPHIHWVTTAPNPRRAYHLEPVGWRLHAVKAEQDATFSDVIATRAEC